MQVEYVSFIYCSIHETRELDLNIVMEVTKQNFETTLPLVEEALKLCDFIAIDLEFTGFH